MWRGAHLPLSHAHTPSQIFQNTLCIICWHKQSSQCLVCPLSICDNYASVGSCSGGPASLCFLGSPVVLELSEGRKYVLMSQVLSNTSVKVFFGTKTSLRPPNFFWGGRGGLRTPCPSYSAVYDILIVLETTEDHKDQVIYVARPVL